MVLINRKIKVGIEIAAITPYSSGLIFMGYFEELAMMKVAQA
jgi:hypothetical protein